MAWLLGEEVGGYGARWYTSHPIFPVAKPGRPKKRVCWPGGSSRRHGLWQAGLPLSSSTRTSAPGSPSMTT